MILFIYDSQNGRLLADVLIQVNSKRARALAWVGDSKQLFALPRDGNDHGLDVSTGKTRSKWRIHSSNNPQCIVLASNRRSTFIAAAANSSVAFYATTHK
jgi:hypothetical protein